jgi:rubrerythrin
MFSKADFRSFIAQALVIEEEVSALYVSAIHSVEETSIRQVFEAILADEQVHLETLKRLETL